MNKQIYFNFPIQLLKGFMTDEKKVLNDIMDYAIYKHTLKLEHGNELKAISDSASYFGITLGNAKNTFKNGKMLFDSIPDRSPMTGINKDMLFEFYENEKKESEKVSLLGYLALRSILGKKEYCSTNNSLWLSRMDGKPKEVKIDEKKFVGLEKPNKYFLELSSEINKYANPYQTVKIKKELRINWGLVTYSKNIKGFYISYSLELKALITVAETNRKSFKEKQYKQMEKDILTEVMKELKTRT